MARDELIARLTKLCAEATDHDEETAAAFDLFVRMVSSGTAGMRATRVVAEIERRRARRTGRGDGSGPGRRGVRLGEQRALGTTPASTAYPVTIGRLKYARSFD
jgi:hypothetical protein